MSKSWLNDVIIVGISISETLVVAFNNSQASVWRDPYVIAKGVIVSVIDKKDMDTDSIAFILSSAECNIFDNSVE